MKWLPANSLQRRLATRLGALFLLATIVLVSVFLYLSYNLVDSLSRGDLFELADELAEELEEDGEIDDIEELVALGWLTADTRYAVFDNDRQLLAASDAEFVATVRERNMVSSGTDLFRLDNFDTPPRNYLGLVTTERSEAGRVTVVAAEPEQAEQQLLNAIVWDVVLKAAWMVPVFIFFTLLVGVLAIRGGLQPLRRTAQEAASIKPEAMSARLSTGNLPSEVFPLVSAVNSALDRLEEGFEIQRRFTANAAHELRTPLAIITGAIDAMEDSTELEKVRQDISRMNRLVEQLLHAARLDSFTLDTHETLDLRHVAHHVLEYMAPLAIAQGQNIELSEPEAPVYIHGNPHAVEDAMRNLIENAIIHGGSEGTIVVKVDIDGSVSICDRGPGVSENDREHIFDRFWRGRNVSSAGAGLGLSIVHEIMKIHGGKVEVGDNPGGGACFVLRFNIPSLQPRNRYANDEASH